MTSLQDLHKYWYQRALAISMNPNANSEDYAVFFAEMRREQLALLEPEPQTQTWVYFIYASQSGPIKIGYTADPIRRLKELQREWVYPLTIMYLRRGGYTEEQAIHRQLAHLRIDGEWFQPGQEHIQARRHCSQVAQISDCAPTNYRVRNVITEILAMDIWGTPDHE